MMSSGLCLSCCILLKSLLTLGKGTSNGNLPSANGDIYFLMEMLINVLCPFFKNKEFELESERTVHSEVSGCAGWNCEGALGTRSLWAHNLLDTCWLLELAAHTWRLLNELLSATDYILNSPQRRDLRVLICLFSLAWTPHPQPPRVKGVLAHK